MKMSSLHISVMRSMPKAELHAHLNGSLSDDTIRKLIELKKKTNSQEIDQVFTKIPSGHRRTLDECFQVFHVIHQLTDTPEGIYLAACDVIKDFASDNVHYLELRTTPRLIEGSLHKYIDVVLQAIDDCKAQKIPILVKLLLSIDRSRGLEMAENVVNLTISYGNRRPDVVVGLDVSGNMTNSKVVDYFPLLEKIRLAGLKLAIHTAEHHDDEETEAILRFHPNRIGHGTFIPPMRCNNQHLLGLLKEKKIPIELCLTSNLMSKTVASYQDHHLKTMLENDIPFAICTDDKGVFGSSLSDEYLIAGRTFSLSVEEMWKISYETLNYGFMSTLEREHLQLTWMNWKVQWEKSCID